MPPGKFHHWLKSVAQFWIQVEIFKNDKSLFDKNHSYTPHSADQPESRIKKKKKKKKTHTHTWSVLKMSNALCVLCAVLLNACASCKLIHFLGGNNCVITFQIQYLIVTIILQITLFFLLSMN